MPHAFVHTGSIADVQIIARPLTVEEMQRWTLCTGDDSLGLSQLQHGNKNWKYICRTRNLKLIIFSFINSKMALLNFWFIQMFQLIGDLFNFNEDYKNLNTSEAKDVTLSLTGVNKRFICTRNSGNFFENLKMRKRKIV